MLLLIAVMTMLSRALSFNICNSSPTAVCVPLRDFQPNCTCILLYTSINVTNETNLYYGSWKIPMDYFNLKQIPSKLIARLQKQIPRSYGSKELLNLSLNIYNCITTDEYFLFLMTNSLYVASILDDIVDSGILGDSEESKSISEWCSSGDCRIFSEYPSFYNSTTESYMSSVLYVVVATEQNTSVIITSTIRSQFMVPRLLSFICAQQCHSTDTIFRKQCQRQCPNDIMKNRITIIGEMKREWQSYLRAMVIANIRARYGYFFT